MSWRVESMSWTAEKAPKRPPERPKTTPKRPQNDQKSDPERQDEKRTEPRRSLARLGPPQVPDHKLARAPGAPFGRPKRHQNRSQNDQKSKRKIKSQQKPIQDDLGSVLRRSWAVLGAILGPWKRSGTTPADVSWKITFSMLRRFEDSLGTNFGRPRCQNDRKWPPRRSPNR